MSFDTVWTWRAVKCYSQNRVTYSQVTDLTNKNQNRQKASRAHMVNYPKICRCQKCPTQGCIKFCVTLYATQHFEFFER